jgi:ubiquinone/menaquinone biosynthesis C-methylase UbiE
MSREFKNVYDDEERARAYAELEFPGTYYLAFRDLPRVFRQYVTGIRALDFGCGAGRSTRFLRSLGFRVVGVDISRTMLDRARKVDPSGDYRLVADGDLGSLEEGYFDLVLSAFTFDNIPTLRQKQSALISLKRLLGDQGRIVSVVSSPDIYINEWASFSTRDYPANKKAVSGDKVLIRMLDVADRRPVEDVMCSEHDYRELYRQVSLSVLETLQPLATGSEPMKWVSETEIAPWTINVLDAGV